MKSDIRYCCRYYVDKLEGDSYDSSLHSLIELPVDSLPVLVELYEGVQSRSKKQSLIHAIWQHRDVSSLGFLLGIIESEKNELLWQEALDGVVTLKASNKLAALHLDCPVKSKSVREAIELLKMDNA